MPAKRAVTDKVIRNIIDEHPENINRYHKPNNRLISNILFHKSQ